MLRFLKPLAWLLCVQWLPCASVALQRSAQYQEVQQAGRPQCLLEPPDATHRARTRLECSERCAGGHGECIAFNYKRSQSACEMFGTVTAPTGEIVGCSFYVEVCVRHDIDFILIIIVYHYQDESDELRFVGTLWHLVMWKYQS